MSNENHRYYIHFENMPPYERLDMLFEMAVSKQKVFATSYLFEVPKTIHHTDVIKRSREIFRRRAYYICRIHSGDIFGETDANSPDSFPQ